MKSIRRFNSNVPNMAAHPLSFEFGVCAFSACESVLVLCHEGSGAAFRAEALLPLKLLGRNRIIRALPHFLVRLFCALTFLLGLFRFLFCFKRFRHFQSLPLYFFPSAGTSALAELAACFAPFERLIPKLLSALCCSSVFCNFSLLS